MLTLVLPSPAGSSCLVGFAFMGEIYVVLAFAPRCPIMNQKSAVSCLDNVAQICHSPAHRKVIVQDAFQLNTIKIGCARFFAAAFACTLMRAAFLLDSSNEKRFRNLAVSKPYDSWGLLPW